jgi:methyl-accepting chemotaxis protein
MGTVTVISGTFSPESIIPLLITLVSAFLALFLRLKKKDSAASYVIVASALLQVLPLFSMGGDSALILAMIPLSITALYLNKWLFIIAGAIINVSLIVMQLTIPGDGIVAYIYSDVCLIIVSAALLLLTKEGGKLIRDAGEKEAQTKKLLEELQKTMSVIKTSTSGLNKEISMADENLEVVHGISNSITSATKEITSGVIGQNKSVTQINQMMKDADSKIAELTDFSNKLESVSAKASQVVTEGSQKIHTMDKQMDIINQAVTRSFETVQELNKNMDEINNFLSGITQIAEQTNMLSLNAAIEAARAGESGKGFAVVAEEVRKLAEQSASTASQIHQIVNQIKDKTKNVLDEANRGKIATQDGDKVVKTVNQNFEMIQVAFKDIDSNISDEISRIGHIAGLFSSINREVESISGISEEQAGSTQDLLATLEEQSANIESMYNLIQGIKSSSDNLQAVIK